MHKSYDELWRDLEWAFLDEPLDYDALAVEMHELLAQKKARKAEDERIKFNVQSDGVQREKVPVESVQDIHERHKAQDKAKWDRHNKRAVAFGAILYIGFFLVLQIVFLVGWFIGGCSGSLGVVLMPLFIGVGFYGVTLLIDLVMLLVGKIRGTGTNKSKVKDRYRKH